MYYSMKTKALTVVTSLAACLVTMLVVVACGGNTASSSENGGAPERQSAHQSTNVDRNPMEVLAMPDHYNNVAEKCDHHGHRVYVSSNKANNPGPIAVIADSSCPGGAG